MGNKRKMNDRAEGEEVDYIAKPPKHLANIHLRNQEKRLIVILERAQLESAKVRALQYSITSSCLWMTPSFSFLFY